MRIDGDSWRRALLRGLLLLGIAVFASTQAAQEPPSASQDHARWVDPFIGTDGTGHTFPGAARPFGMVQVSPDTGNHSWDHTSGYQYRDDTIMGFSQNHLSGTGLSDLGDVLLQPFSGAGQPADFASHFDRASETASPGHYGVRLTDHGVSVDVTATERVALHRYRFEAGAAANLLVDLQHGIVNAWIPLDEHVIASDVTIEARDRMSGFIESSSWVRHRIFFTLHLSQPVQKFQPLERRGGEQASRWVLRFGELGDEPLLVKVALSTVSVEGAEQNLAAELPGWDFDAVSHEARAAWNRYFSRIDIVAPDRQKRIFYTALYHLLLQPNQTADVDGRYGGYKGQVAMATADGHYSTFSLWDTYRAAHPLYTILAPEKVDDFVNSLMDQQAAQGFLPIWGLMNQESYTMIGNHAVPVVVDAVLKGIPGIDSERAWRAVWETLTVSHRNSNWDLYERYGYYPFDRLDRDGESVSRTVESAVDDHAAFRLARHLGKAEEAAKLDRRARFYRNLFDAQTGFLRGRDSQGAWRPEFDPLEVTSPMNNPGDYTEANAWQYLWAAQHDPVGMIELFGSRESFGAKLDEFFSVTVQDSDVHLGQEALIGQYAHGNEPSHHIAYLYRFADRPARTSGLVTRIYDEFYDDTRDGIQGNEDCGQMSAWYLFTTLGFYPVDPASGEYVLGAPQVERARVKLPGGKTLEIHADPELLDNPGFYRAQLNGQPFEDIALSHEAILAGGELRFETP